MENSKQRSGGSSPSSFTETLFGPKDGGSSSGLFGSVFGPSSTGLGKDSSHCKYTGSAKKEDFGSPKHSAKDCKTPRSNGAKERTPVYQTETAEPSYLSSSIYYGGQEVYPPTSQNYCSQHTFKKGGGGDEDPIGSSASRGNWWQGSLYY